MRAARRSRPAPTRLRGLARSMLALLDELGHQTVDVLGISWGGGLAQRIAPDIDGGSVRTDPTVATRLLHQRSQAGSWQGYVYQLLAAAGWTSLPFLPLLRQPTLVLTGDDDPIIPTVNGRIIAALVPHARLHVYVGGHLELIAAPDRLLPEIECFLTSPHEEDVR